MEEARESPNVTKEAIKEIRHRGVRNFYQQQNKTIDMRGRADDRLLQLPDSPLNVDDDIDTREPLIVRAAVTVSFCVNIVLFILIVSNYVSSKSLTVLASAIDSALDLFSGAILYFTQRMINKKDKEKYPVGKMRHEDLGIIVFASVMATASLQVIFASAQSLSSGDSPATIDSLTFIIIGIVLVSKLSLLAWCFLLRKQSSSCAALAQDHLNDCIINSMTLVALFVISYTNLWWFDAAAAITFSIFIVFNWAKTARGHLRLMAGKSASRHIVNQITYFASRFHPLIKAVDTVRAYHSGLTIIVEVDIILPPEMTLREAHDIGEGLQNGLEGLENIQRAFVHIDWEGSHHSKTEHKQL